MVEITPALIQSYLDTKADEDIIGHCHDAGACLVAETILWKYPEYTSVFVAYDTIDVGKVDFVVTPIDIAKIIIAFDDLFLVRHPITKQEFLAKKGALLCLK